MDTKNMHIDDILKKVKRIHFIGIGGAGMCPLAEILIQLGYDVSGSDNNDTETFRRIERDGILHRAGRNAAFSGKNSTISYKCAEISAGQFMTDEFLIFGKLHVI